MLEPQSSGRYRLIAAGLAVLIAAAGIYWLRGGERKVEQQGAVAGVATSGQDFRPLAAGALAAFVVKPQRKPVADVGFQDGAGQPLKLGDWKGRVALVNLWATWCAPCRKEMPALAELQRQIGSKDFEVVAISVDRKGVEASAVFLKETGADALKLYVEPTARILDELQAVGLPATLLIDRQGNEIGRLLGPAEWASPEAKALIEAAIKEGSAGG